MNAAASVTDLGALFTAYGSDKTRSGYHTTYQHLLGQRRHSIATVLEIGIGTLNPEAPSNMLGYAAPHYRPGGSLRAWRDWFPNAYITGIDTQPDTMFTDEDRIITRLADSTNLEQINTALSDRTFNLIIDDGNHNPSHQILTFANLWWRVQPGGHYVIEDILGEWELQHIIDYMHPHHTSIGPHRNLLIIHA